MTRERAGWVIEERTGTAAALHGLAVPTASVRTVRALSVTAPAIVLGSTQSDDIVDQRRAAGEGVAVAHRRSGGAAVLLDPEAHSWIDVFVPAGDPLWHDDVVAAADWVGAVWRATAGSFGLEDLEVHHGGLVAGPWSSLVCFAGRGPGEVFAAGRKLVGVSQRRTREWVRVQTAVHRIWDPVRTLAVLDLAADERSRAAAELADVVATIDVDPDVVLDRFVAHLPD